MCLPLVPTRRLCQLSCTQTSFICHRRRYFGAAQWASSRLWNVLDHLRSSRPVAAQEGIQQVVEGARTQGLCVQGDLRSRVEGRLQENRRVLDQLQYLQETERTAEVGKRKLDLLRKHRELGIGLTSESFIALRESWKNLFAAEKMRSRPGTPDSELPSSSWTPAALASYVETFAVLPWSCEPSGTDGDRAEGRTTRWLRIEDLKTVFQEKVEVFAESGDSERLPKPLDDPSWLPTRLAYLHMVMDVLALPNPGRQAGKTLSDHDLMGDRLQTFSASNPSEAHTRLLVDSMLLPFCSEIGVSVNVEEALRRKAEQLPSCRCDYVLRHSTTKEVLGAVEVKRCKSAWQSQLAQGVVQCFWQLLSLRAAAPEGQRPMLGVVTDGQHWVCLELHKGHLCVTPVLDLSRGQWTVLLRFLSQRLQVGPVS